jgi:hypothetical protein
VVFVGTDGSVATEGRDRTTIAMPGNYDSLIDQVKAAGNPRTALAVQAGGAVSLGHAQGIPGIVFSSYNGESQGTALADVLFGKQNPSGHLNFTWYADDTQLPDIKNYGLTPSQTGGIGRTYQYFTGTPAYPFGYGLSYSKFAYSHVRADDRSVDADGQVTVHVDVTNTGSTPGATVAQLYAATAFTVPGVELPRQRLAGFKKTNVLAPGQTQHVAIPVRVSDLAFWDEAKHRQVVYDGLYRFGVGADAGHLAGTATVAVTGRITPRTRYVTVQPGQVVFAPGDGLDLTAKNPWIADDTAQAAQHVPADHVVEAVNNDQSFVDLSRKRVAYHSSDPRVAEVSRTGKVTMVAPGVATISVTVDGVTGSTPVVVKQPFTLTAPGQVQPGGTYAVTTTLPNPAGARPLRDVTLTLSVPDGWTAQATSPSTFATVPAGQTVTTTWQVGVPASAQPGKFAVSGQATFTSVNGPGTSVDATTVVLPHAPYASLPAAYNNVGVSDDASPGSGNFDGGNASFSAQALAAATPSLTPGATFTHDGLTFTWPDAQPGSPDNVVAGGVAGGQTIAISGSGHTLGLIGAGDYGSPSGTATVTYTDGTTESHSVSFADWWANAATGGDILTTLPYLNNSNGRLDQRVSLYYAPIPLQPGKTVKYVTLPDVSDGAQMGTAAMHIFTMAIG